MTFFPLYVGVVCMAYIPARPGGAGIEFFLKYHTCTIN